MAALSCSWACDDPTCEPECKPFWETIPCTCSNPGVEPVCTVSCQTPYVFDACPVCEIQCQMSSACGDILCGQLVTSWACRKPSNCPSPTCELSCEPPSCPYSGSLDPWQTSSSWWILFLVIGIVAFLWLTRKA